VLAVDPDSVAYRRALTSIEQLGEREVRTTTAIASRFGDQPIRTLEHELSDRWPLAASQRELRRLAERLLRFGEDRRRSAEEVGRATADLEERIGELVGAIDSEREIVDVDNGVLNQQERALWTQIHAIRECAAIAARIDEQLEDRIAAIVITEPAVATRLRNEVLYATRSRRRDLLLQLAVATQGYAALRRIEQSNLELIWLMRATTTTTVTAMRTAMLAQHAFAREAAPAAIDADQVLGAWREVIETLDDVERRRQGTLDAVHRTAFS
jgi:uncharacterized protein YaaN involved in tellurite resistance